MENRIKILNGGSGEERRYQVDLSEVELGLISDLLNSVSDLRAVPLRRDIYKIIRANNAFVLLQKKKIVKCNNCKGTGSVQLMDAYYEYKMHTCNVCKGEGRFVVITSKRHEVITEEWKKDLTPLL